MNKNSGFTVVELVVVAPAVILAIGAFIVAIIAMTGETLASRATNSLAYDIDAALSQIEQDINLSDSFLATNQFEIASPQGLNDDSTDFSNASTDGGNALILSQTATTTNPIQPSSTVKLIDDPYECSSPLINQNKKLSINIVYFIKDNTLWRRTLLPADYASTACITPWQLPSCSPGYSASFCKTNDMRMVDGVSSPGFTIQYFASKDSSAANSFVINPDASTEARGEILKDMRALSVSILAEKNAGGRTVSWSASLRVSLKADFSLPSIAPGGGGGPPVMPP